MSNPELRRYAWLELGLHRVVAVPLVLAALVTMVVAISDHPAEPLAYGALAVFAVIVMGWGAMRAYASVLDEVRERTWDFQRMAALDPLSLAIGKLFGAPLLSWYIGVWCLLVYAVAGVAARLPHILATLIAAVAFTVLLHSLAVAASALAARTALAGRGRRFGGLLMLLVMMWTLPTVIGAALTGSRESVFIHWWMLRGMHALTFAALSAVLFAGWAAFAAWRSMARELREPAWWWGWPAFAAFTAFWWAGIHSATDKHAGLADALALVAGILAAAGYLGLSLEPLTPVSRARLSRLAQGSPVAWHQRVPLWLVHALLGLAAGVLALLVSVLGGTALQHPNSDGVGLGLLPAASVALALMMLRDAAVVSCFTLTAGVRRPLAIATFYIAVADLLLPALFAALQLPALARAVFPFWGIGDSAVYPMVGMAVHLLIAGGVLWFRLRHGTKLPDRT